MPVVALGRYSKPTPPSANHSQEGSNPRPPPPKMYGAKPVGHMAKRLVHKPATIGRHIDVAPNANLREEEIIHADAATPLAPVAPDICIKQLGEMPLAGNIAAGQIERQFIGGETLVRWNIINKDAAAPGAWVFPNMDG